jgi:hypothetical protein
MNWIEVLQNLSIFTVGTISIVGIIAYFGRTLFEHYLSEKINSYKSQLDRENDNYKHQLQLATQEHQIKFTKLHTDRTDVIRTIYDKLQLMRQTMLSLVVPIRFSDGTTEETRQNIAAKAAQDFLDYFHRNDILFDESICKMVNEVDKLYWEAWTDYTTYNAPGMKSLSTVDPEFRKERAATLKEAWNTIDKKVPVIEEALKKEFRGLLGVSKI